MIEIERMRDRVDFQDSRKCSECGTLEEDYLVVERI